MECRQSCRELSCRRRRPTKFTLLELLLVISILMISASLLFPAGLRALASARTIACTSNLRQLAVGMMDYTDDFDGYVCPPLPGQPAGHWLNYMCVESLDANPTLLQCPSLKPEEHFNPYGGEGKYAVLTDASYIMNIVRESEVHGWSSLPAQISTPYECSFGWVHGNAGQPVRIRRIVNPGNKLWILDAAPGLQNPAASLGILRMTESDYGRIDPNTDGQANAGERQVGWQHAGGFNALFGDAHVEYRVQSDHEEWNAHQTR